MSTSTENNSDTFVMFQSRTAEQQPIRIPQNQDLSDRMLTEYFEKTLPATEISELCSYMGALAAHKQD